MAITKQQIIDEIRRCGNDPVYFINKYVKIRHPTRGLIPFAMYDYQEELVRDYVKHRFNIILKARQLGISEVTAAFAAWLIIFRRQRTVICIATKADVSKNLLKKIHTAIRFLPRWMVSRDDGGFCRLLIENKTSLELSNGSVAKALASKEDAGHSEAVSFFIVDEASRIPNLEELWKGIYHTVQTGGRIAMISTPNGVGGLFHQVYDDAINGANEFHPTKLMWWVHPEHIRDERESIDLQDDPYRSGFKTSSWFRHETKAGNLSPRQIAEQYECFGRGTPVVTSDGMKEIQDIKIGDQVLTHRGRFRSVLRCFSKQVQNDKLVELSLPLARKFPITVTKEHPILTATRRAGAGSGLFDAFDRLGFDIEWKSQDNLRCLQEDFSTSRFANALFPVFAGESFGVLPDYVDMVDASSCEKLVASENSVRYFRQKGNTKRTWSVNHKSGRIIGLFLSEGCILSNGSTQFSFSSMEDELIDEVVEFCKEHGLRARIDPRTYSDCTTVQVSTRFMKHFIDLFVSGTSCYDKKLKEIVYYAPRDFIRGVISGVWSGDGFHEPKKSNVLRLTNRDLIWQLRTLMTAFGILPRISMVPGQCKSRNSRDSFLLEVYGTSGRTMDDCLLFPPERLPGSKSKRLSNDIFDGWFGVSNEHDFEGDEEVEVFNIEVEEDNSYVVGNLVVHNCNFNSSGQTVIRGEDIERISGETIDPIEMKYLDRRWFVWNKPIRDERYFISADVARGDGRDYSGAHVWKSDMSQVSEYYGKIPVDEFAAVLCEMGREYNDALLIIENNSLGLAVLEHVRLIGYPNVYFSRKGDMKPGESVNMQWGSLNPELVPGFTTSAQRKALMIAKFEEYVRNRTISIRSKRLLEEMRTFVWLDDKRGVNAKAGASSGRHDDLFMAASIGAWIKETFISPSGMGLDLQRKILDSIEVSRNVNTQIPGASKDPRFAPQRMIGVFISRDTAQNMQIKLPNGEIADFNWLIDKG